jgi:ABC-2 type transport system permease protein
VDRILISLKYTLLRHSSKGLRIAGWVIGAAFVAATWAVGVFAANPDARGSALSLLFAAWTVGAMVGPVLMSGAGILRPDYFALLPIERRALSRGLFVSVFVSIAAGFVLLAFAAASTHALNLSPATLMLVAVGAPLTWIFAVTLSRLVYGLLGAAMGSKIGVEIAGIQFGLMFAAMFTGWMVVQAAIQSVPALLNSGLPEGPITAVLDAFPSSWMLLAIESAAAGDWGAAAMLLGALAALDVVLVAATIALLMPKVDVPKRRGKARRRSAALLAGGGLLPKTQLGAVIGKEMRQWTRDPWRSLELRTSVWTGAAIAIFALVSVNYSVVASFAGLIVAFMMGIAGLNLYGQDGSAVWQTIVGEDATSVRSDVRGRQWAMVLVFLPQTLLITALFVVLSREWWVIPVLIAALPALFGASSGAAVLTSAVGVSPGVDPRRRTGPNDANGNVGVHVWIAMLLTTIGVLPTVGIVIASLVFPAPWMASATIFVGIANGFFIAWIFGRIAIAYLQQRMPDVFSRIRYGRIFRDGSSGVLDWMEKTTLSGEQQMHAYKQKQRDERIAARR